MQSLVRRVAASLPPHYRSTLTMRALEDRSYEEISATLDIPVTVARLWYCRARKRFRTAFIQALVARRDVPEGCQEMGAEIAELIEGTLTRGRRDAVQAHLADCSACRQTEDELRNTAFRAPARLMLVGLGLARLPMSLRRSLSNMGNRSQQIAGEIALGAAGTFVLAATSGLGGVPSAAQAAAPPRTVALAELPSGVLAVPRRDDTSRWSRAGTLVTVAGEPGAPVVATVPGLDTAGAPLTYPDLGAPVNTGLPINLPSHPALTVTQRRLGQAANTALATASSSRAHAQAVIDSASLPLISD
jgi:hypothetical protein